MVTVIYHNLLLRYNIKENRFLFMEQSFLIRFRRFNNNLVIITFYRAYHIIMIDL